MFFNLYRRLPVMGCTELVQGCAEQGWLGGTRGPYRGGLRGLMGATLPTLFKVYQLSNTVGRYILNLEIAQSNPVMIQMFSESLWEVRAWKVMSAPRYCLHTLFWLTVCRYWDQAVDVLRVTLSCVGRRFKPNIVNSINQSSCWKVELVRNIDSEVTLPRS